MTDITTQAVERLAQRHTLNDDEAATLRALAAERDAAIAEAHATGHERAAWKDRAEKAEAQLAGARDAALLDAAKWHVRQAEAAMGALHCGSENSEIRAAGRVNDMHREAAHAILALRDKPAPAVTVQEAAKVLLDLLKTPSEKAPIEASHIEDVWTATFRKSGFAAVKGFLRAIAGGGDE